MYLGTIIGKKKHRGKGRLKRCQTIPSFIYSIKSFRSQRGKHNYSPNLLAGGTYLGQFSSDNKWYRVEVKIVMEEEKAALVTYIDYGNKEVLPFAR